jgi:hypothetical protein
MPFAHIGLALALLPGIAAAPPPDGLADRLLTEQDLPSVYRPAKEIPYDYLIESLFDRAGTTGDRCRLPIEVPVPGSTPRRSVSAVFDNGARFALELESLTEVLAAPGTKDAKSLADAAAALSGRCPGFETPRFSISLKPLPMPRLGDASAAFQARLHMKAIGVDNAWVDVNVVDVAVVAKGDVSVTVILIGYFDEHDASLADVTRRAVALVG